MLQKLKKVGGSFMIVIPKPFVDQNHLNEGDPLNLDIFGNKISIEATMKRKYTLAQLMDEMQETEMPQVDGWDGMPDVGQERL